MTRFTIRDLVSGPEGLRTQLPIGAATTAIRSALDGTGQYFCARLDAPLKWRYGSELDTASCAAQYLGRDSEGPFLWVDDIVLSAHNPGEQPYFGMRKFQVDLAIVTNPALLNDSHVDLAKVHPVGLAEIDDEEGVAAAPPTPPVEPPAPPTPPIEPPAPPTPPIEPPAPPTPPIEPPAPPTPPIEPPAPPTPPVEPPQSVTVITAEDPPEDTEPRTDPFRQISIPVTHTPPAPLRYPRAAPWLAEPPSAAFPAPPARHAPLAPVAPHRGSRRGLRVAAAVLTLVGLIAVAAVWTWKHGADEAGPATSARTSASATTARTTSAAKPTPGDARAVEKLLRLTPAAYPSGACAPTAGAGLATVTCQATTEPDGPHTATFTLAADKDDLDRQFRGILGSTTQINCPGGIQSPGPWHHNATPQLEQGLVYCGYRGENPVVAWTDSPNLVVNIIESRPGGAPLEALYRWWTDHS